jgi:DNA-directed RNA polymerase subunit alpha
MDYSVSLPSKPRIVSEEEQTGIYEIDGLFPGYGHTLGNSLRRIILSSLPGAAITRVRIEEVPHEFAAIEGVKEDVVTILLNLKRIRFELLSDEPQVCKLTIAGPKDVTAADITLPGQVRVLNPDQHIAEVTSKQGKITMEFTVEKGLGYVPRDMHQEEKMESNTIALDATFTPIRRVNYEVENMRVGDRTDFNRLRLFIETDGTLAPRAALEKSIEIMVHQLKAIIGFKEEEPEVPQEEPEMEMSSPAIEEPRQHIDPDILKTRIESLNLSSRTINALANANIRTTGGLARKKEEDILAIEGLGVKGLQEIKKALSEYGIQLR